MRLVTDFSICISPGKHLHARIAQAQELCSDVVIQSALVSMYGRFGELEVAEHLFSDNPLPDTALWNGMLTTCFQNGLDRDCLVLYNHMQQLCAMQNKITYIVMLSVCSKIASLVEGKKLHTCIVTLGCEADIMVGTALINMYSKCGHVDNANDIFGRTLGRDLVMWNAMIAGYAQSGKSGHVFHFFEKMLEQGIKPDVVSFLAVMCACSRNGLFHRGKTYFEAMTEDYGMVPTIRHHSCMIDLLGRTGEVDKAVEMVKKMPFCPNLVVWHTILSASKYWGTTSIGKQAFQQAIHLDKNDAVAYTMITHILANIEIKGNQTN